MDMELVAGTLSAVSHMKIQEQEKNSVQCSTGRSAMTPMRVHHTVNEAEAMS